MIADEDLDTVRAYVAVAAPLLKLRLPDEFEEQVSTALAELLVAANCLQDAGEVDEDPVRHHEQNHDR